VFRRHANACDVLLQSTLATFSALKKDAAGQYRMLVGLEAIDTRAQ
jgi:hypothetical protein